MLTDINLPVILAASFIAASSPGPATLALASTAMARGRQAGLAIGAGILTGSATWLMLAALGFGALMRSHAWAFEVIRIIGGVYLLFLAWKSARSAWKGGTMALAAAKPDAARRLYLKGLMIHLTNPKVILFFGALFALGIPASATPTDLAIVCGAMWAQSLCIFLAYAFLFSSPPAVKAYMRAKRWFEAAFAALFGAAAVKLLTAQI